MFHGRVVHGDKIGRTLGFPTANLDISFDATKCKPGVYAAYATLFNVQYKAALVINDMAKKVEVYLFAYTGQEFYGEELEIDPVQKVSEIEKFDSFEELKEKITTDIAWVEKILKV